MKDKCQIARDLMPLVIDGACSEESSKFVKDHVSECPPCAEVWGEMKTELPRVAAEKEKAELEKAAKAMKKKRRKRIAWTAVIAAVLSIMLFVGGKWLYNDLTATTRYPMSKDEFSVQLYKMSDGTGLIVYDLAQNDAYCGQSWSYGSNKIADLHMCEPYIQLGSEQREKLYGGYRTYKVGYWTEEGWIFDANAYEVSVVMRLNEHIQGLDSDSANDVTYTLEEKDYVQEVWMNYSDGRELIYTHGDEVPTCSPEMEAYLEGFASAASMGKPVTYDYDMLAELRAAVPEWQ